MEEYFNKILNNNLQKLVLKYLENECGFYIVNNHFHMMDLLLRKLYKIKYISNKCENDFLCIDKNENLFNRITIKFSDSKDSKNSKKLNELSENLIYIIHANR